MTPQELNAVGFVLQKAMAAAYDKGRADESAKKAPNHKQFEMSLLDRAALKTHLEQLVRAR